MKQELDIENWKGILVYVEFRNKTISPVSLELIGEAYRLSLLSNEKVSVVAVGSDVNSLRAQLVGYPLAEAYLYELGYGFTADAYAQAVSKCIAELKPAIVLMGGTSEGRALAPRLAVQFHSGLTADCTDLTMDDKGDLIQTRPAFGGNIMASIVTRDSRPQFVTVREKVKLPVAPDFSVSISFHWESADNCKSPIEILSTEAVEEVGGIGDAELLIVAGRGVQKKEDLKKLRQMAEILGGKLASSRALVEKGWTSPNEQIGLSGNTVKPSCIITFGVSGTVQFMAGMKQSKNIIAVNTDPHARIFDIAHYPICADLIEVIPHLTELVKGHCL